VPLASWGTRLGAAVIDFLILLVPVIALVVIVVAVAVGDDTAGWVTGVVSFLAYAVVALFYAPVLMAREGAHNGQTWGKQLFRIRVVRTSGAPMDFTWSACREAGVKGLALGFASTFIPLIPYLLDFLWPLWDDQNRALHDMVVSTHVVQS
jgi:uncharacterized RDD family membrane protein YckC